MTKLVEAREAKQMEDWFYTDSAPIAAAGKTVKWNLGLGKHTVVQDDKIVFSGTKEEAEQFRDAA